MRRLVLALGVVATLVGGTYSSMTGAQQRSISSTCKEIVLTQKPGWTISGSWSADGSLLLVDPLFRSILRYSNTGNPIGPIGGPLQSTLRDSLPIAGKSRGTDLILQVTDGLMVVDRRYRPVLTKSIRVENKKRKDPLAIGALWQWEPVGQSDIMAFGDVHLANTDPYNRKNWYSSFLRFSLDDPSSFRVFRPLGLDDDETNLLRLGFPYIATIGDTAYILSMGNRMVLFKNEADSENLDTLNAFPPGPDFGPSSIAKFESWDNYVALMKEVEKSAMPVGLYAWNRTLYILSRTPNAHGGTRWTLSSIDPERDEYTGQVDLPINANHVLVVPGPQVWAFVEKGPVLGKGLQEVPKVLFIPSKQLQAPLGRNGAGCPKFL